jgi:rhamnogalacturonyl hydrolase YesR
MKHLPPTLLLALACSLAPSVARAEPRPAESYPTLTRDGGWCWFSDPRAIARDGKTYTGWVTRDGSIQAAQFDHATGAIEIADLHPQYERDDHDNPAFAFTRDGRLMAFYTKHGGKPNPAIHLRIRKKSPAFSEWEPEVALPLRDDSPDTAGISYCNPIRLSAENDTLYLFWRGFSYKPTMAKSSDDGRTWTPARVVFATQPPDPNQRPYAKYASNGRDRIHFLFTDGHPRNEPNNSVYYACYRDGAFYKADGTRICGADELPIQPHQADKIYDGAAGKARAWIWGIAFDRSDAPVVVYTRLPAENNHRYHYARWDGTRWADSEICAGGRWFPQTPRGDKEREPHYSSGLALDPSDPSVVYLTRSEFGVREIERWSTPDGGATWNTEPLTRASLYDNVRPFAVAGDRGTGPRVLLMNLHGGYRHYTDYHTAIHWDGPPVETAASRLPPPDPADIEGTLRRVADWQLAHPSRHHPTDWTQAAAYAGFMAVSRLPGNTKYRDAMLAMGERNRWELGSRPFHADDHAVGQTYAELALDLKRPELVAPMRARFDAILANPPAFTADDPAQKRNGDTWTWCDALFMGPPAWVRLAAVTGEKRYRDFAIEQWWVTSKHLYDPEEHLYFRDRDYFAPRAPNGRKIFWSRGNGWVMAGLARTLEFLPPGDPGRADLEAQFKAMAAAVLACQQPDGLWRASLLDPGSFPMKETSGSGFFTYAFAWGIRNGLLDRPTYGPAAEKAWRALVACVRPDGRLTHVQPIGASPYAFPDDSTEVYGVGAFLLAGSEMAKLR